MPLTLQTLDQGDTNYIGKHNTNYGAIASAIDGLTQQVGAIGVASNSQAAAFRAAFGRNAAVIGEGSYKPTGAGATLTVAAGFVWIPTLELVATKAASTAISFSGLASATYYIEVGSDGEPYRADAPTNALYSVVWDGAAFGTITRLITVAWGYEDFNAAKTSAVLGGQVYNSLDGRMEAAEGAAASMLPKTVAGTTITLTTAEGMENFAIHLTGAQSANIDLEVPAFEKPYYIINDCTGNFTVTVKVSGGSGVATLNGTKTVVYSDGTNVLKMATSGGEPFDVACTYNGTLPANQVVLRVPISRTMTFPASLTGSTGVVGTAPTALADFDLRKNGTSFGTMSFAASATTATFAAASATTFSPGDVLTVVAPSVSDVSMANLGFTLQGSRA